MRAMKLIVQIPCLNEEGTLPATLADIPRSLPGIDRVEVVVVDDGSTDGTAEAARRGGADHVVRFAGNRGLGHAFAAGVDFCLGHGADVIVNTDGDNQYCGADIAKLIAPILARQADIVIGDREPDKVPHFSRTKKFLQRLGSRVVSRLARTDVPDVASGFRAYSREAAMRLICATDFDHTVDHVIQAGRKRLRIVSVPIRTNDKLRESRLFSHIGVFVTRSIAIMVRAYSSYRAFKIFFLVGSSLFAIGFLIGVRFLYFFFILGNGDDHIQSLILAAVLLLAGFQVILTGVVADLINSSRAIAEDIAYRQQRIERAMQTQSAERRPESE